MANQSWPEIDPTARVLVGVMNNPRDLEIARQQGWYRIPLHRAPRQVGAEYLAFYQTAAFGPQERWHISYYAPVRRYFIVTRRELLPEEPDHPRADELYYKIEIEALQKLPRPIPSRRLRRITFIPTTLGRLLSAEEINELWCASPSAEELWAALRAAGILAERCYPVGEGESAYEVDLAIPCCEGLVAVLCQESSPLSVERLIREHAGYEYDLAAAGWTVLTFSERELRTDLTECVARVIAAIVSCGGVSE